MTRRFGPVVDVNLLLVPDYRRRSSSPEDDDYGGGKKKRKHRGFAFVTFDDHLHAKKAVEGEEPVEIKKRPVAIDFSMPKVQHVQVVKDQKEREKREEEEDEEDEGSGSDEESDEDGSGSDDRSGSGSDDESGSGSDSDSTQSTAAPTDHGPLRISLFLRNLPFDATIINSTILRCKLRERSHVLKQGLLLTVPFHTVEEYLAKLQFCSESTKGCRSLGMVYLAVAVRDFYIPTEERSEHKIQSQGYGIGEGNDKDKSIVQMKSNGEGLLIHLKSVPKCISHLRAKVNMSHYLPTWCSVNDYVEIIEKLGGVDVRREFWS